MDNREQFEAYWGEANSEWEIRERDIDFEIWQACAEQKDKEIESLKHAIDHYKSDQFAVRIKLDDKDAEIAELKDLLTKALDERDYFYKIELARQAHNAAKVIK